MGTHNLLLRLNGRCYLEVIAINQALPAPGRPRWFGLDILAPDATPALSAWVVRTEDIHAAVAAVPEALGGIEAMSRGDFAWLITIAADGVAALRGAAPALIEWRSEHPADRLQDRGLSLLGLELRHPQPERVGRVLRALGLDRRVSVVAAPAGMPELAATIDTAQGRRMLAGPCR